ncbi:MFS transporter, partial [Nocardioides sp. YIM 152588]|uniref:MFS transporter n=1 Tax=Nocardioides sp. YIM 152588 TaxID=3158259 RepID=UPI0032E427E4
RGLGDRIDRLRGTAATDADGADAEAVLSHAPAHDLRGSIVADARRLLGIATLRGVIAAQALLSLGVAGIFYWLPTFLERTEGLGYDAASGLAGGVGGTGIVVGILLGSRLGDRATAGGWRIRVAGAFLTVGTAGLTLAVLLPGVPLRVGMIAIACAGFAGAIPNLTAAAADVVPVASRGMGFALLQFLTTLGGAFGPFLIGLLSDLMDSLSLAMLGLLPPLFAAVVVLTRARAAYDDDLAATR